ncbi:hypothetical protein [Lacrimispora algidixylanolytica]|uniref:Uncharacterized protein n=1 Tax=Lacrimispora algidixylanolytica TaxID=94868 RepID=A0A419TCV6_9FIRM|nr:hypothetical protein [Lacrimispora algidixylanolytica]RKD35306.1 hypothetical protein BET01_02890 [Lacrimispora algidixylanolytica]
MEKMKALKQLLDENNINNQFEEVSFEDETLTYLYFQFPVAREYEEIRIRENDPNIDSLLNSSLFNYRGIINYESIWSAESNCIECGIISPGIILPSRYLFSRLYKAFSIDQPQNSDGDFDDPEPQSVMLYSDEKRKVSLGYSSKEFALLSAYKEGRRIDINENKTRFEITLLIENINTPIKTQDEAKSLLEKVSYTLFFQLSLLYNIDIVLRPRKKPRRERNRIVRERTGIPAERKDLKLEYEYDEIPMSLYWFAQSNKNSPFFMYFALYQVLEFYFPIYSTLLEKTIIQNLIKDPCFNINKDSDVVKLLNIIKKYSTGSLGDEREQLNTTLRSILRAEDVINYIKENSHLETYYSAKESDKISEKKIRLTDNAGILNDIAMRIYDIRCSIVHNKASESSRKILPLTKDNEYLANDVQLLEFITRKAIIANSRPFSNI